MDLNLELEHIIRKGYDWYQANLGEVVIWFEYDAVNSEFDHVYDEPSMDAQRKWRPPVLVPTLWVSEEEDDRTNNCDGRLVTPDIRLAVPMRTLTEVGLSAPRNASRHHNDLLVYRGNYWTVNAYQIRGRMRTDYVIVGVTATLVDIESDMVYDELPDINGLVMEKAPQGFPSDGFRNQTFDEHDLPAFHSHPQSALSLSATLPAPTPHGT